MVESLQNNYIYLIVFSVNIAAFTTGTAFSWSSPVLSKLTDTAMTDNPLDRVITDQESSWIGSLYNIGGIVSPFIFTLLVDKFGRRLSIFVTGVPFLISYLTLAFAKTIYLYYFARIVIGCGIVSTFCVIPLYVSEISPQKQRGFLCSSTTCFLICGILFSYCVGPYISLLAFNLILAALPCVCMVLSFFFAPESPYFLIYNGREEEAKETLAKIRGKNDNLEEEIESIKSNMTRVEKGKLTDIFKTKAALKALLITVTLFVLQQFSGINVILSYTQSIFEATGSTLDAATSSIISGAVQVATCVITPIFSDRLGRRVLLLFSISGSALSQLVFGVYFYLQDNNYDISNIAWLPLVSLIVFIIFFNSGFGSLPSVITGELFPLNVKSIGASLVTSANFLVGFFLTFYFNDISKGIGMDGCFWMFSGICVLGVIFVYVFVFETNGRTLDEIQEILSR